MAISRAQITPDLAGIREMVEGDVGRAVAEERGRQVEEAARRAATGLDVGGTEGNTGTVAVPIEGRLDTNRRPSYFVGIAHPAGLNVESKHRTLGSSLGAAG